MPIGCKNSLNWLATFYHMHNVKPFIEPFVTTPHNSEGWWNTFRGNIRVCIEIELTILTAKHLNNINNSNKVIPLLK